MTCSVPNASKVPNPRVTVGSEDGLALVGLRILPVYPSSARNWRSVVREIPPPSEPAWALIQIASNPLVGRGTERRGDDWLAVVGSKLCTKQGCTLDLLMF